MPLVSLIDEEKTGCDGHEATRENEAVVVNAFYKVCPLWNNGRDS